LPDEQDPVGAYPPVAEAGPVAVGGRTAVTGTGAGASSLRARRHRIGYRRLAKSGGWKVPATTRTVVVACTVVPGTVAATVRLPWVVCRNTTSDWVNEPSAAV
jgi:hypothetical protein